MMRNDQKRQFYFLSLVMTALFFQNCTGGFDAFQMDRDFGEQDQSSVSIGDIEIPIIKNPNVDPVLLYEGLITEMQSVWVTLDGTGPIAFPNGFPKGAVYDESQRRFYWIPKKGQAGTYQVQVHEAGEPKGYINLKVANVFESQLKAGGPPFLHYDGDVGYIYVHGAGDLDRCANRNELLRYWGNGPAMVSPDRTNTTLVCYDSRKAVADVAHLVANQILNAKCGRFNRCIIFTHSMGGLLMEHMFLHARAALPTDPEPSMYASHEVYNAVRDRTLFVISLASAAGGSKAASIANRDGNNSLGQEAAGFIGRMIGENRDSTRNLIVKYASNVVAPYWEDPGVPFFMVPGFSEQTADEASGVLGNLFNVTFNRLPLTVFNGSRELAILDKVASFQSRSDGLVDFRSACGVASDVEEEGPGRLVPREYHFAYCWRAKKKPNHYVWFMSNLNHYLIIGQPFNCRNPEASCVSLFPDEAGESFFINRTYTGMHTMEIIRQRMIAPTPLKSLSLRKMASAE